MTVSQQAHFYLTKYRNQVPGPPLILRQLTDEELLVDLRETERVGASFDQDSSEAQVVGNVIRGWIGHELRNRSFTRQFPHLLQ
jgi:hypothetical protein